MRTQGDYPNPFGDSRSARDFTKPYLVVWCGVGAIGSEITS